MASYTTLNTIKRQMSDHQMRYWTIDDSSNNLIAQVGKESTTITPEQSFDKLKDIVDDCSGDYVKIYLRERPANVDENGNYKKGNNGGKSFGPYNVLLTAANGAAINGFGGGSDISLHKTIWELEKKMEMQELNRKIEGLQGKMERKNEISDNPIIAKFIDKIGDGLIGKMFAADLKGKVNGHPDEEEEEPEPGSGEPEVDAPGKKEEAIILDFLQKAATAMGNKEDTIKAIQALGKLAKEKPGVFKATALELIKDA